METLLRYQNAMSRPSVPLLTRLGARIELDQTRLPVATAGSSSVVFRLTRDSGPKLALRLPFQESRAAEWAVRYGALNGLDRGELAARISPSFEVFRHGVSVVSEAGHNAEPLTALVSTWIEGPTLIVAADRAAKAGKSHILKALAGAVRDAVNEARKVGFVHGDITAQNLIVGKTGHIAFVDLDTAAWPGSPLGVVGSGTSGYRHPAGSAPTETRDGFALLVLYASLMALAEKPDRRREWGDPISINDAALLLSDWDLGSPESSDVFRAAMRSGNSELVGIFTALKRVLHEGPMSIERHLSVIPSIVPLSSEATSGDQSDSSWDLNAAVRRVRTRFDGRDAEPAVTMAVAKDPDHPTWNASASTPPVQHDDRTIEVMRAALRQAVNDKNESEVARLWLKLARDPIARTMTLQIEELYATTFRERILREQQQGRDGLIVSIGEEAQIRRIPLHI
ncbi:MAG: hypothetical protein WKF81_13095, partial [Thermomicrobiales bacterium]